MSLDRRRGREGSGSGSLFCGIPAIGSCRDWLVRDLKLILKEIGRFSWNLFEEAGSVALEQRIPREQK